MKFLGIRNLNLAYDMVSSRNDTSNFYLSLDGFADFKINLGLIKVSVKFSCTVIYVRNSLDITISNLCLFTPAVDKDSIVSCSAICDNFLLKYYIYEGILSELSTIKDNKTATILNSNRNGVCSYEYRTK